MRKSTWRLMIKASLILAMACGLLLHSGPAQAITFGTADATADFNISGNTLTITLTNLVNPINEIVDVLTGIVFTFSTAPTGLSLTGAQAGGTATCSGQ